METLLNCGPQNWAMIAGIVLTYGVLALGVAALIKYLTFAKPSEAA